MVDNYEDIVLVRGGGDLATGTIHRLWKSGFKVVVLETDNPAAIRRQVSVCEAVYNGETTVCDMTAIKIEVSEIDLKEDILTKLNEIWRSKKVPVIIDPLGKLINILKPMIVVDGILAKKNLGTNIHMAPVTIALGPGFEAGVDVKYVVETKRGHCLGKIYTSGFAIANTGIPGIIAGYGKERVIHALANGRISLVKNIGDRVEEQEVIATIKDDITGECHYVKATIVGLLRGIIRDGYYVTKGFKIADIDPRLTEYDNCFTISDKARCIAGSVLEIVCMERNCI